MERPRFYSMCQIHPFSEIQGKVFELRSNGYGLKEVAAELEYSPGYIRKLMVGRISGKEIDFDSSAFEKGVYGTIQLAYGARPSNIVEATLMVEQDVLFRSGDRIKRDELYVNALQKLFTKSQSHLFELAAMGMDHKEIANRLGITPQSVASRISGTTETIEQRSHIGIYGNIELVYGRRPYNMQDAFVMLHYDPVELR